MHHFLKLIYTTFYFCLIVVLSGCAGGMNMNQIRDKANQGDPAAQFQMGASYYEGMGVPKDPVEAVNWLRKSAEQGSPEGQNGLGYAYQFGEGVEQNYSQAAYWYEKAAEQSFTVSISNLANLHKEGQGVEKNLIKAFQLNLRAAELGGLRGMNNVGYAYWKGEGTDKNLIQAHKWLDLARFYTQRSDDMNLKWEIRDTLDQVKKEMTGPQIQEAEKLTKEWDEANR